MALENTLATRVGQSVNVSLSRRAVLMAAAGAALASQVSLRAVGAQETSELGIGVNYDTALFDHLRSGTTPFASSLVFENLIVRADDGSRASWIPLPARLRD